MRLTLIRAGISCRESTERPKRILIQSCKRRERGIAAYDPEFIWQGFIGPLSWNKVNSKEWDSQGYYCDYAWTALNCGGPKYTEVKWQRGHYTDELHPDQWGAEGPEKCYSRCPLCFQLFPGINGNPFTIRRLLSCPWQTAYYDEPTRATHHSTKQRCMHTQTYTERLWFLQF